ncbi:AAA family ATPase [Rossellomorea vietnamensis]|uniref:AAA family ATPase n=2 Tax=Rossellomorea vietnamensis TaxID=218284 RepID=A0A5D4KKR9_9BACI|nr:AAA family ATPase [Rossellomorea vietnamensis]
MVYDMTRGKIILLNGVSSSGKSTLAQKIIEKLPDYFHLSIDDYDCIIEKMEDRENQRLIPVPTECFFHRTMSMFSDNGINLVVDQILFNEETQEDCYQTLKDYPVLFVGVHCPAIELERREMTRRDRPLGQACGQLSYVHQQQEEYDIEIDTNNDDLEKAVQLIKERMENLGEATGWKNSVEEYFNQKIEKCQS